MLKNRFWAAAGLFLVLLWAPLPGAAAGVPNVTPEMQSADFWTNKLADPDTVIMSQREIAAFNRDIVSTLPDLVYDLTDYPSFLSSEKLAELVNKRPFPVDEDRYANGRLVERAYYDDLLSQMNLNGIGAKNEVAYAVTVRRANIRTFPTADESLEAPDDVEFDLFQETAVGPAEPVLILHRSLDAKWCFVQVYNYNGWMPAADLAVAADKESWLEYVQPDQYLVVTGNRIELNYAPADQEVEPVGFTMGTRIPMAVRNADDVLAAAGFYLVKLPTRGENGELVLKMSTVPAGSDVAVGYMPYTRANIIRQAFKILGERYGWGGMFDARDCSAFVMDVYRSFGLLLPRNGDEQERSAGRTVSFASLDTGQRYELLDSLLPGASLHTPTHEMLYLGEHNGLYYVIHDITSYGDADRVNADGSLARVALNRVTVTDLSLTLRSGRTIIDSLTGGKQVESGAASAAASPDVNVKVFVNGSQVRFPDEQPYMDSSKGRVYIPVRFVSEALGADVEWQQEQQNILINKDKMMILLHSGSRDVYVDGRFYTLDAPLSMVNGRNMIPLRFVSEALGAAVEWTADSSGGHVDITK
jgi:hypothetical protein